MNPDELALHQRIRDERPQIRLCCPRGHFIITVVIIVESPDDATLELIPNVGRRHHLDSRLIHPSRMGNPGFTANHGPNGQTVTLSCRRCPRWELVRDYQRLATELAVYALAGHREHRLSC